MAAENNQINLAEEIRASISQAVKTRLNIQKVISDIKESVSEEKAMAYVTIIETLEGVAEDYYTAEAELGKALLAAIVDEETDKSDLSSSI